MKLQYLLIFAFVLAGSLATTAANANGDEPKKQRFQYVNSGTLGFSFFPLLGLQKVAADSVQVDTAPEVFSKEEQELLDAISSPVVF